MLVRRAYIVGGGPAARGRVAVCTARWALGGYSFRTRYVTFERPRLAASPRSPARRSRREFALPREGAD